ncbi:hypothetical protein K1W54_02010 [Micromonospora sp. CPCC 205371]|nr:hypothetical protein [Micromonospora sp. CPCC 205371]
MTGEEGTIEVAPVLDGQYAITVRPGESPWWGTEGSGAERVPGTGDDRERWTAARRRFEEDLTHAATVFRSPVKRPWWRRGRLAGLRWLPGYRAEQRARFAENAALLAQARARYRPVEEEIHARVRAVREERQRAARAAEERHGRLTAVIRRPVWGWVQKGRASAVVFRHDVADTGPLRADARARGPFRLDVLGDELYEYGMTTVRWDAGTKQAVVADCAAAGHPLSFAQWWAAVGPWEKAHRGPTAWCTNRPPWPVPTRRSRERLERGTSHHSGYGVGDVGGFGSF